MAYSVGATLTQATLGAETDRVLARFGVFGDRKSAFLRVAAKDTNSPLHQYSAKYLNEVPYTSAFGQGLGTYTTKNKLTTSEAEGLREAYPIFDTRFEGDAIHPHAAADTARDMDRMRMRAYYDPEMLLGDIGGNVVYNLKNQVHPIHSCNPRADVKDSVRSVETDTALHMLQHKRETREDVRTRVEKFRNDPAYASRWKCNDRAQDCTVQLDALLCVHVYDMTLEDLARARMKHHARHVRGVLNVPLSFLEDERREHLLETTGLRAVRDGTGVRYGTAEGGQWMYSHDFENVRSFLFDKVFYCDGVAHYYRVVCRTGDAIEFILGPARCAVVALPNQSFRPRGRRVVVKQPAAVGAVRSWTGLGPKVEVEYPYNTWRYTIDAAGALYDGGRFTSDSLAQSYRAITANTRINTTPLRVAPKIPVEQLPDFYVGVALKSRQDIVRRTRNDEFMRRSIMRERDADSSGLARNAMNACNVLSERFSSAMSEQFDLSRGALDKEDATVEVRVVEGWVTQSFESKTFERVDSAIDGRHDAVVAKAARVAQYISAVNSSPEFYAIAHARLAGAEPRAQEDGRFTTVGADESGAATGSADASLQPVPAGEGVERGPSDATSRNTPMSDGARSVPVQRDRVQDAATFDLVRSKEIVNTSLPTAEEARKISQFGLETYERWFGSMQVRVHVRSLGVFFRANEEVRDVRVSSERKRKALMDRIVERERYGGVEIRNVTAASKVAFEDLTEKDEKGNPAPHGYVRGELSPNGRKTFEAKRPGHHNSDLVFCRKGALSSRTLSELSVDAASFSYMAAYCPETGTIELLDRPKGAGVFFPRDYTGWLLVSDNTEVYTGEAVVKYLERAKTKLATMDANALPLFVLCRGPPGAGKTRTAVMQVKAGGMILVSGRLNAEETREKKTKYDIERTAIFAKEGGSVPPNMYSVKDQVRTYDSLCVVAKKKDYRASEIFCDEVNNQHCGVPEAAAINLDVQVAYQAGDENQIPWVNRHMPTVGHDGPQTDHEMTCLTPLSAHPFADFTVTSFVSYRCPADVCMAIGEHYGHRLRTTSEVVSSMKMQDPRPMPHIANTSAQLIPFYQLAKKELQKHGAKTYSTVHEVQGNGYPHTVIVRGGNSNESLFMQANYVLTALSRHTKSCVAAGVRQYTDLVTDRFDFVRRNAHLAAKYQDVDTAGIPLAIDFL